MKLRFHPRGAGQVRVPGSPHAVDQPARYIGRRKNPKTNEYEASEKPHEVDASAAGNELILPRYRKLTQRGEIWAADEQTAQFCGVPFVPVELKDGVFQPKSEQAQTRKRGGGSTEAS